jgi:N-glycosylase/DNA lyase
MEQQEALDSKEQQEVMDILYGYFMRETKDEDMSQEMLQKLGGMVQQEGVKLVHLGNTVYLTLVRGKGLIEFHPYYENRNVKSLVTDLKRYIPYLKALGVQTAYTYQRPNDFYARVIKESKIPFKSEVIDGQATYYTVM